MTKTEPKRWTVIIGYHTDAGLIDIEHEIDELEELHDLVEGGPNFNAIERIEISLSRGVDATLEGLERQILQIAAYRPYPSEMRLEEMSNAEELLAEAAKRISVSAGETVQSIGPAKILQILANRPHYPERGRTKMCLEEMLAAEEMLAEAERAIEAGEMDDFIFIGVRRSPPEPITKEDIIDTSDDEGHIDNTAHVIAEEVIVAARDNLETLLYNFLQSNIEPFVEKRIRQLKEQAPSGREGAPQ
jgi:hypothetical protein